MKRTSDFFSGSKGTNKIVIMALPVMVLDGLKNKHMDFPYGSFISFGVTRNISKLPFRYSCIVRVGKTDWVF